MPVAWPVTVTIFFSNFLVTVPKFWIFFSLGIFMAPFSRLRVRVIWSNFRLIESDFRDSGERERERKFVIYWFISRSHEHLPEAANENGNERCWKSRSNRKKVSPEYFQIDHWSGGWIFPPLFSEAKWETRDWNPDLKCLPQMPSIWWLKSKSKVRAQANQNAAFYSG